MTRENFTNLLPGLQFAASQLKGGARRMFLGQLAIDLGRGGKVLVSEKFVLDQSLKKSLKPFE